MFQMRAIQCCSPPQRATCRVCLGRGFYFHPEDLSRFRNERVVVSSWSQGTLQKNICFDVLDPSEMRKFVVERENWDVQMRRGYYLSRWKKAEKLAT